MVQAVNAITPFTAPLIDSLALIVALVGVVPFPDGGTVAFLVCGLFNAVSIADPNDCSESKSKLNGGTVAACSSSFSSANEGALITMSTNIIAIKEMMFFIVLWLQLIFAIYFRNESTNLPLATENYYCFENVQFLNKTFLMFSPQKLSYI